MMNFLKTNNLHHKIKITTLAMMLSVSSFANIPFPISYTSFLDLDCDACGCSNSGGSLGMGGVIDNNFIGIRYLYQQYQSKDGIFSDSPKIDEHFNTFQLWSRIPVFRKLEAQVFIPYHSHNRKYTNKITKIAGLGDISVLVNYSIIDIKKSNYNKKTDKINTNYHLLKIGSGIKLPTGSYSVRINNAINPSFQLGTGSFDYIANLQYVFKHNAFGVTNYINYYLKSANKKDYKFGNQLNFSSTFFYAFKDNAKKVFVPSFGISGEFYDKNQQFELDVKDTNGEAVFSNIGIEYNTKQVTLGASAMYPIYQNLAQGLIKIKMRTTLYFNYNF